MELHEIMQSTNTCRHYKREPVSNEVLEPVLGALHWAPTGGNRQPVSVVVIRERETKQQLQEIGRAHV